MTFDENHSAKFMIRIRRPSHVSWFVDDGHLQFYVLVRSSARISYSRS